MYRFDPLRKAFRSALHCGGRAAGRPSHLFFFLIFFSIYISISHHFHTIPPLSNTLTTFFSLYTSSLYKMDSGNSPHMSGDGSQYTGGTQIPPVSQTPPTLQNTYFNQVPGGNIFGGGFTPYFPGNQPAAFPQISGSTFVGAGRPITPQAFHWSIGRGIDPNYGTRCTGQRC